MSYRSWCNLPKVAGFVIAAATSMITPAHAELLVTPEAITLAGTRKSTVSTTLTLSAETDAITLEPAVSDLRRADGSASIAAADIAIKPDRTINIPADAPTQVKITIDLAKASANGEFTGALYLYDEAGRQVIPLTVKVKAEPIWPWTIMSAGVILGFLLTSYRVDGQPRDAVLLQASRLQARIETDTGLNKDLSASRAFKASIESKLKRVMSAIEDQDIDVAQSEIDEAKRRWSRWEDSPNEWLAQFEDGEYLTGVYEAITSELDDLPIFMEDVKGCFETIHRRLELGQYADLQALSEDYAEVRRYISFYKASGTSIMVLEQKTTELKKEDQDKWKGILYSLQIKLNNTEPKQNGYQTWQTLLNDVQQELAEATKAAKQPGDTEEKSSLLILKTRSGSEESSSDEQFMRLPPGVNFKQKQVSIEPGKSADAQRNLRWFTQARNGIAIIFLAWLGMIELYSGKPTFGAEPLSDYFALLAWGFGAELTRESLVKATQNLGVASSKE